jgi:glycosyltransferase involved in cell wall biosynthesis
MEWPRITIVTPSYNQAQYLDETMRSVLDQNYPNLEYIVMDGGSKDDSVDVIKRYADRLAYWVSEKDSGQSNAINKGFARATGDVYGFINSDDVLYPDSLRRVGEAYAKGAKWIVGWSKFLEPEGDEWPFTIGSTTRLVPWFTGNPIPQQSSFWAASVWKQIGPLNEKMHYAFDYEYWMRIRFDAGVQPTIVRKCLAGFRLHADSKTVSQFERFDPEDHEIRVKFAEKLPAGERSKVMKAIKAFEAEQNIKWGWEKLRAKDVTGAKKHASESLRLSRSNPDAWRLWYCARRGY